MSFLRALLVLSRGPGLPTIWSHCIAGWWLGGGGNVHSLPLLLLGATCLYLGGSFTHDAASVTYDRQHCRARPIPSGSINSATVWIVGWLWFALGTVALCLLGRTTGILGIILTVLILLYNATHRALTLSPFLLAFGRSILYWIAASTAIAGVTGLAVWSGFAITCYFLGTHFLSQQEEDAFVPGRFWPVLLLACPIYLALIVNGPGFRESGLLLSGVLGLWIALNVRRLFWPSEQASVTPLEALRAGLVFSDWLACANAPRSLSFIFILLFAATLILQRVPLAPAPVRAISASR